MPKRRYRQYEAIKEDALQSGLPMDRAQEKAARITNAAGGPVPRPKRKRHRE